MPPYPPAGYYFSTSTVPHHLHTQGRRSIYSSFHTVSLPWLELFMRRSAGGVAARDPTTPKMVTPLRLVLAPRPNQPEEFFEVTSIYY